MKTKKQQKYYRHLTRQIDKSKKNTNKGSRLQDRRIVLQSIDERNVVVKDKTSEVECDAPVNSDDAVSVHASDNDFL